MPPNWRRSGSSRRGRSRCRPTRLVVADTFGFHARGPSRQPSLRVEIWAYGRRSPFLPLASLLPWTTAALGRRSLLAWKFGDLIERAGVKKHRWRERVGVSPFDPPGGEPVAPEPAAEATATSGRPRLTETKLRAEKCPGGVEFEGKADMADCRAGVT